MGFDISVWGVIEELQAFAELVAAAEADKHNTGTHTCSDRCQRYACVAVREAVAAEREACLKMLDDHWYKTQSDVADAIRARGEPSP
jgi:hypothetical protein